MTDNDKLRIHELKKGGSLMIGRVTVKKDPRNRIILIGNGETKNFNATAHPSEIYDKINEMNSVKKENTVSVGERYAIAGTSLIVIKTLEGYDVYDNGKRVQVDITEDQLSDYVDYYKVQKSRERVESSRKSLKKQANLTTKKKVLYNFILILSVIILVFVYVVGVKTDGVEFRRENQDVYEVVKGISNGKHPGKKFDKFDEVYYTLNYWLHNNNYFMTEVEYEITDPGAIENNNGNIFKQNPITNTYIYTYYSDPNGDGDTKDSLSMNLSNDFSYSGFEFNAYFRDKFGKYVSTQEVYRRLAILFGIDIASQVLYPRYQYQIDYDIVITQEDINAMYLLWDTDDVRSNVAYNYEIVDPLTGGSAFDRRVDYYGGYLMRNGFFQLFLNHPSKFVNDYSLFFSAGWANWMAVGIFLLYMILWFSIWLFRKDNLKIGKPLTVVLIVLAAMIIIPLTLQYLFEGLSKEANQFLEVIENTKFTTTSTLMNFIFDYAMKFANFALVGIVTIIMPLNVVRYFVLNAISKLDKKGRISTMISPDTIVTQDITSTDWSSGR